MKNLKIRTVLTRKRYDRMSFVYDLLEAPVEWLKFARWRSRFRHRMVGKKVLEVGVGTGKNLSYYPPGIDATAMDLSPRMLAKAVKVGRALGVDADFCRMDAHYLAFPDHVFDTVFAAFVFCSVPDPVLGLSELRRVCKPEGRLLLLEHMRPDNVLAGLIFDLLNPLVVRTVGANVNRRTVENIQRAGWRIVAEDHLSSNIVRWIEAVP